ncbi:LysR substrate-binding domain-containing protein [Pseudogulbenkiania ferrooxidans]|uniref:Transcriptional regulator, LysR family n=1 Tax=Pseudogulbenkiania ferrooxidans 2002 TaxID=279714 RepID=B9Z6G4_9NEIS|nr:LysR substrate-binding domain-containing protein [Pseudogulbenkiania ferrooxidans]EEG07539.1 transcriptional regulator, LysR family [Pseudogulbenkiania ferrooxidans 2002]
MNKLPPLNALRIFEAVARLQSFTKAAEALYLTQSAVSHQIRKLEEHFGFPLLVRGQRGIDLTPEGAILQHSVHDALLQIDQTCDQLSQRHHAIRIKSPPSIAVRWLVPHLQAFKQQFPDLDISVSTVWEEKPAFDWGLFDLAIQYGIGDWPGVTVELLHREQLIPVAAPALLQGRQTLTPDDLATQTLIHSTRDRHDWRLWLGLPAGEWPKGQKELLFDADVMAVEAARCGLGVALIDPFLVQDALDDGSLLTPLQRTVQTGKAYYLVRPPHDRHSRRLQPLVEWLQNAA